MKFNYIKLYKSGLSTVKICKQTAIPYSTLRKMIIKAGIMRSRSEAVTGEKNSQWKGNRVKYGALHDYIKWHLPATELCQSCKKVKPYDLANISQEYKRDLTDWEWLCRRCHMKKDGRMNNLKQYAS